MFRNMSHIRPARDRQVLATFKGSAWGTGDLKRLRTMCYRDGWRENEIGPSLYPGGPRLKVLWNTLGDYDYLGILNDTIFCPQPAGTTGETHLDFVYSHPRHLILITVIQAGLLASSTRYTRVVSRLLSGKRRIIHFSICSTGERSP